MIADQSPAENSEHLRTNNFRARFRTHRCGHACKTTRIQHSPIFLQSSQSAAGLISQFYFFDNLIRSDIFPRIRAGVCTLKSIHINSRARTQRSRSQLAQYDLELYLGETRTTNGPTLPLFGLYELYTIANMPTKPHTQRRTVVRPNAILSQ